jgi:MFS family permease
MHLRSLGISPRAAGWIFSTLALSSIFSPMIHGRLADRRIPAERLLAITFTAGSALLFLVADYEGRNTTFLFVFFMLYWLLIAPGYGMINAISMRHLANPREEFGGIRLWGTVGWMLGSYLVAFSMVMSNTDGLGLPQIFYVGSFLSLMTVLATFRVEPSPPMESKKSSFLDALKTDLLRQKDFVVYLAIGFGVCCTTPFVFQLIPAMLEKEGLSRPQVMSLMTLGQIPEILSLWLLPWVIRRVGFRGALFLGIFSWVIRYGVIGLGASLTWTILSMPLQGMAIGFFLVGGQVFVDEKAPRESRASLQSLQMVVCSGMGSFVGSILAGECQTLWPSNPANVFLVPCIIDVILCMILLIAFHPNSQKKVESIIQASTD